MNSTTIVAIAAVGLIGLIGIGSIVGAYNTAIGYEATINASYKNNQNILGQYGLKVVEVAHVSDKYADQAKELVKAAMQGRYGEEGSQATWQWLKEQNPTLDVSVYKNIQQVIEAGRNQFQNGQTMLIDQCRGYDTYRKSLVTGFVLNMFGFPKDGELNNKCQPIVTAESEKAYTTGKAEKVVF